ncbi:hypothetical protein [Hoeflea sp.]|uniref:hypothetical protein n=1 Tax=Hoeflea sp. TaxID=1940281 RepID=UPI003B01A060
MPESENVTNDLIFEQLKKIQHMLSRQGERLYDLRADVTTVKADLATVKADMATMTGRMDRIEDRLDRIERRLDLADAPAE